MGFWDRVFVAALFLGAAALYYQYRQISSPIPAPKLDVKAYWGPGSAANYKENAAIKPYDIAVKPELITDLKAQLERSLRLHDPLEGVGFEYGFNSRYLQEVVKYWRDSYLTKWTEREAFLKKFPHFETQIQGLRIHFIHVKPKNIAGKKVLPLLLLHGWPGSVREFYDIIPLLTTPNDKSDYVFEVIAPSLIGYGWSQPAAKPNFGTVQMSVVLRNLMLRVGHEKYLVQGGDWGSIIGNHMVTLFPQNVLAYHSNMCINLSAASNLRMLITRFFPSFFVEKEFQEFYKPLTVQMMDTLEETGYMHIQSTKPDTIGTALAHNPVGLAAYILEKFSTWTNADFKKLPDGGLTKRYTLDALLDNVMIYYVTNSITTSQRLYAENFSIAQFKLNMFDVMVEQPVGCARFKHDLLHTSDFELKAKFQQLVHSTHYNDGGHFAAMELPQVLYNDFIVFVEKVFKTK